MKLAKELSITLSAIEIALIEERSHGFSISDIWSMLKSIQTADNRYAALEAFFTSYKPYSLANSAVPFIPKVQWNDIGGLESLKQQLQEVIVWPLKHASAYQQMDSRNSVGKLSFLHCSGILLFGPPGTGMCTFVYFYFR